MSYHIKKLPYKSRQWKAQWVIVVDGVRKTNDIPETDYMRLGFRMDMTLEEALERKKQLNAQEALKRIEAKRQVIAKNLEHTKLVQSAFLTAHDIAEFESKVLFARRYDPKLESHWSIVREILCTLELDPADWFDNQKRFYDWFSEHRYSPSYVKKLRRVLNDWGLFISRKYKTSYVPLPAPKGYEKERIADAYFEKNGEGMASAPLTPEALEKAKSNIPIENYNWLYLTVWFGLRSTEVDNIAKGQNFQVTVINKVTVLRVYQTKLVTIPRPQRWKLIPCVCQEQLAGLNLLTAKLRRPGTKIMKNHFGPNVRLHGGRKNFTDLMLDKGHSIEDISSWLGHQSIEQTWQNYRNRQRLRLTKVA